MQTNTTHLDGSNGKPLPLFDPAQVKQSLQMLLPLGQVTELRVLDAVTAADRWPHTATGFFDDSAKLIAGLGTLKAAKGIYFVPNPVDPALLARSANRIRKVGKGDSTSDGNVISRRWLLIDADPQRATGISSTEEEHIAALGRARAIFRHLKQSGWPDPIAADSGNGAHLLFRVDLPVDDAGLTERCLQALASRFDDGGVTIDTTVHNPSRIWKLYGTLACKGDSTPDRPHRMSRILSAPQELQAVSQSLLETLAAEAPNQPRSIDGCNGQHPNGNFDIDSFIERNGLEVQGPGPYQGGRLWVFRKSPVCDHDEGAAFLIQLSNGALSAGCHHNSCSWAWRDLRAKYEPRRPSPPVYEFSKNLGNGANPYTLTPETLGDGVAYKPFPVETLPTRVKQFVEEAATAIGCDPSFVALPTLASLARAVGNSRVIRLKKSWVEPAIIWAAIVGRSGSHKTPAMQLALSHLQQKQAEAMTGYVEEAARHEQDQALYDRDYQRWKRSKSTDPPPWAPKEPVLKRYIVNDITIEALVERLSGQFDGVLVVRDELAGWLDGLGEYKGGKGSDTGHWLASWSGAPLTVDRKTGTKKTLHVPRASVSLVGGIQPLVLRRAIGREHLYDGLCARVLLAMPEPRAARWSEATINFATDAAMAALYEKLLTLDPGADEEGNESPHPVPLTPEAKDVWVEYYDRHRAEQTELDDDLAAAWSKLEAYSARLALIFQLCSWASDEAGDDAIDEASMRGAIALSEWFGGEARRVYGMFAENDEQRETRELVDLIRRKGSRVTPRELKQSSRRFGNVMEAEAALNSLAKAGIGSWTVDSTATKQRHEFVLHDLSTPSTSTNFIESRGLCEFVDVDNVDLTRRT